MKLGEQLTSCPVKGCGSDIQMTYQQYRDHVTLELAVAGGEQYLNVVDPGDESHPDEWDDHERITLYCANDHDYDAMMAATKESVDG